MSRRAQLGFIAACLLVFGLVAALTKGDRVMVTGRLRQRSWETPEGDKRR